MDGRVERRPDARIVRSAIDEVKSIQALLADVYKDAGDGRTLLRELVQNADDAEADRLVFAVFEDGLPGAGNTLLRGPSLVTVNNGPFKRAHQDALHQAVGGSKAGDAGKVGRFGIGLKSVFHLCEALVYVGAEDGVLRPGALNPWAGTGDAGDADPIHPDWDGVGDDDLDRLLGIARELLGNFENGLLQWVPLRRRHHLDRAQDSQYGLGQACPSAGETVAWFERSGALGLLLAQCGHLVSIEADHASTPQDLGGRRRVARIHRPGFQTLGWVGRHDDDAQERRRSFGGRIDKETGIAWHVTGVDALGHPSLRQIRDLPEWPTDPHWHGGRTTWLPRKALGHAAVTVLRPSGAPGGCRGAVTRWAVFLPLEDAPIVTNSNALAEQQGATPGEASWEVILHGYFWPSQDRRSIPGVTDDDSGAGDGEARVRWNRAVRDEALLPLLPQALSDAAAQVSNAAARSLVEAVRAARVVKSHLAAVTKRDVLVPVVCEDRVQWKTCRRDGPGLLSIRDWHNAPPSVRTSFVTQPALSDEGPIFIDEDSPRIGGTLREWPPECIDRLLACIPVEELATLGQLRWVEMLGAHFLRAPTGPAVERAAAVARWLAARVGEGILSGAVETGTAEEQLGLRAAWWRVFDVLPRGWTVAAPLSTHVAVVELASSGVLGPGLLPVPLGRGEETGPGAPVDTARVDQALLALGTSLRDETDAPQRRRLSRLLLAETLLSVRGPELLGAALSGLPLLRAKRLPDDRDEAWSVTDLQRGAQRSRVFARPGGEEEGTAADAPNDPKRAVTDLGRALAEPAWLVDGAAATSANVPLPTPEALSEATLQGDSGLSPNPAERLPLLQRLAASGDAASPSLHAAMVVLLAGTREAGAGGSLFHVRRQDADRAANQKTLALLLGLLGKTWGEVDFALVEPLPHALVETLGVRTVDRGALQELLQDALDGEAIWSDLEESAAVHLLRYLHGAIPEDRERWRRMPLHRGVDGARAPLDERAKRAVAGLQLPPELQGQVRLLDPDPEVADLYLDVLALDGDGILHAMLVSERPHEFAPRIVDVLRPGGATRLPSDSKLRALLREAPWLPCSDGVAGLAPAKLLLLSQELEELLDPLERAGALGGKRGSGALESGTWQAAADLVEEILGRPTPARRVAALSSALEPERLARAEEGAYLLLPQRETVTAHLVDQVLSSALSGSHQGWVLVRAVADFLGVGADRPVEEAPAATKENLLGFAGSLCGKVPASGQRHSLLALSAARPARESAAGALFRTFLKAFAPTELFSSNVLPHLDLPTQDGQWRKPREIGRSASGVARRHRLQADLRGLLQLDADEPLPAGEAVEQTQGLSTDALLDRYFASWLDRVPAGAVGAFLALLGNGHGNSVFALAQKWMGEDVSVDGMRRPLVGDGRFDPCAAVKVFVSGRIAADQKVEALNLLGERVSMEAGSENESVFAVDPVRRSSAMGLFWEVSLRELHPENRTAQELLAFLGGSVDWWAARALKLDREAVRRWWSKWGTGSQAQVGPVQASILAHLPLTLQQLDVSECAPLRDALREAQRAQRRREQATAAHLREAIDAERKALDHLASLIRDDAGHQQFVFGRVQKLMERFGYRADSVLLELAQNADDALSQAAEIVRAPLPRDACRLVVRVSQQGGRPTVDVLHNGRPINDTGGAAFPAGRDRQWDQDLYFMMLLNLSGKPGEEAGKVSGASTTGRFGLGFKSVHLVSDRPSVVSGFLAFSIAGGLLPVEEAISLDDDLQPAGGHRPTRVRLPLRTDVDAVALTEQVFRRFDYARTLLPAFARGIREVVVEGAAHAGVSAFDGERIPGAPGWSIAKEATSFRNHGHWRLLRFRPADAGRDGGTVALAVGLRDGRPTRFPADVPFLWNVTPTSEDWGCGYAANGPFKLDPGRSHVSLDDPATLRVADLLGDTLGKSLVELHDAIQSQRGAPDGLPSGEAAADFLGALWEVLAAGLDTGDQLRRKLLLRIHGPGRGLSAWVKARPVVPSGMHPPFARHLPSLDGARVEVASTELERPEFCRALARMEEPAAVARRHHVISEKIAAELRPLLGEAFSRLTPSTLFLELAEGWGQKLTPERLRGLRPLADDASLWRAVLGDLKGPTWGTQLRARAADGTFTPLRKLLLPPTFVPETLDTDVEDELRRASFAPERALLDSAYIESEDDAAVFVRLRARHEVDAAQVVAWYGSVPAPKQHAALRYLLEGKLQKEVLERLLPAANRPVWLADFDHVQALLEEVEGGHWWAQSLLVAFFPERFREGHPPEGGDERVDEPTRDAFFKSLTAWWDQQEERRAVVDRYEAAAWPAWLRAGGVAEGLRERSRDHWLGLLVLGACRSLGWSAAGHHRSFLEDTRQEGWWEVFQDPDDTPAWMKVLRDWQDRATADLKYLRWMSLFPSIYQLSRFLEKYRTLLMSAGRRPAELYQVACLLAPRADEALTGAGQHFDAPPAPLNMGLHWVLRELVRLGVIDGEHLYPDCWVPSDEVIRFLRPLGLDISNSAASNPEKARAVFEFLSAKLDTRAPTLHRAFDIPLRHVSRDAERRRCLGLEE